MKTLPTAVHTYLENTESRLKSPMIPEGALLGERDELDGPGGEGGGRNTERAAGIVNHPRVVPF